MKRRIACQVLPGQFDNEQVAIFKSFDGKDLSLFVPGEELEFTGDPSFEVPAQGTMSVDLLNRRDGLALIRLPREIPGSGYFATVNERDLQSTPEPSHA